MRVIPLVAKLTAVILVLGACGSPRSATPAAEPAPKAVTTQPSPPPSPPAATPAPAKETAPVPVKPVKLRWAVLTPKLETAFQEMAVAKGFFAAQGLDVEVLKMGNDADATKALISGDVDITESAPTQPLAAIGKGAKLMIIGGFNQGLPHALFVSNDIKDYADLAGRRLGITTPGSLPHVVSSALLEKKGVKTDGISWVNVGGSGTAVQALIVGKIDAAAAAIDFRGVVEDSKMGRLMAIFRKELPEYTKGTLHVRTEMVQQQPDVLERFLIGYANGIRYALDHKDETLALAAKITGQPAPSFAATFDFTKEQGLIEPNGYIEPAAMEFMQQLNVKFGLQDKVLPMDQVATWKFQQAMIGKIGAYKP